MIKIIFILIPPILAGWLFFHKCKKVDIPIQWDDGVITTWTMKVCDK